MPFIAPPASFVVQAAAERSPTLVRISRTRPGRVAVSARHRLLRGTPYTIPRVPDVIESGGYDVVHFPTQVGELTDRPSIYQPWDLQHLHFPQFFTGEQLRVRDALWRGCSERAHLRPRRVAVRPRRRRRRIRNRPGTDRRRPAWRSHDAASISAVARGPVDAPPFALYPAQAWAHKNHTRLLDAIALLRSQGLAISLVCPGQSNARLRDLRRHAAELGLEAASSTSRGTWRMQSSPSCTGAPAVSSSLPSSRGSAFLSSKRSSPACRSRARRRRLWASSRAMLPCSSIRRTWSRSRRHSSRCGPTMCCGRGSSRGDIERAEAFSWDRLARSCRALYRAAARAPLGSDDRALLAAAGVTV